MAARLDAAAPDFEPRFAALLAAKREQSADVDDAARSIIEDVRARGDAALIDYTRRFDALDLARSGVAVTQREVDDAIAKVDAPARAALELAHARIEAHHRRQLPQDARYTDGIGVELGHKWTPVESAGLYVPGGKASYPSSLLMNAIPARVAGVSRIAMAAPAPQGEINPLVLAAARLCGVDEIYRIGGAQAVAALAYGTQTIAPVVKIVGPGNAYVAAAKRRVFGVVGIDMIAGPSEVVVVATGDNNPSWIAADLLAQAEHDEAAQAILITDDARFADAVEAEVARQTPLLTRARIAAASWETFGAVIVAPSMAAAPALINRLAPEHLELAGAGAEALLDSVRNAGAIFLGPHTPEAVGDYTGGSNHVLPTARSARFASGLGVLDFMKRTSILRLTEQSLRALAPATVALAEAEGLTGHARSVTIRTEG
ncbi:MAG: histidinol dehydrogenase [Hyphomicrobiales bacterium]|nr:histidinol dehydrogenase [Hyphomicrobiales bacterium]